MGRCVCEILHLLLCFKCPLQSCQHQLASGFPRLCHSPIRVTVGCQGWGMFFLHPSSVQGIGNICAQALISFVLYTWLSQKGLTFLKRLAFISPTCTQIGTSGLVSREAEMPPYTGRQPLFPLAGVGLDNVNVI